MARLQAESEKAKRREQRKAKRMLGESVLKLINKINQKMETEVDKNV